MSTRVPSIIAGYQQRKHDLQRRVARSRPRKLDRWSGVESPKPMQLSVIICQSDICNSSLFNMRIFSHQKLRRSSKGITHNGGVKCKGVGKSCNFRPISRIARKRLKIDGYMLRCVWQALNPLSIHVTFTAIVPGAYPGEAKMCQTGESFWHIANITYLLQLFIYSWRINK